jgi:hypothetical protein
MHGHQAEAAALVETQCINVVVGGNDPQATTPLPPGKLPDRLDQGSPRPAPLLASMEGENLALLPVPLRRVREHPQQMSVGGLGDKRRMVEGMDQFPKAGRTDAVVPGQERLDRSMVGDLPRTDIHRITVTAMQNGYESATFSHRRSFNACVHLIREDERIGAG